MIISEKLTDESVLVELGARICKFRLEKNWTQSDVAKEAGVGLRTVQRFESGEAGTQLSSFVRILRVLGLLNRLDQIVSEADNMASPMTQLRLAKKTRKRASRKTSNSKAIENPGQSSFGNRDGVAERESKWTWGE